MEILGELLDRVDIRSHDVRRVVTTLNTCGLSPLQELENFDVSDYAIFRHARNVRRPLSHRNHAGQNQGAADEVLSRQAQQRTLRRDIHQTRSVVEDKTHGFTLLVAEGESVAGSILEIGNTNTRYQFPLGARGFVEQWNSHGPAHHFAIGVGHVASQIDKLARLLRLNFIRVC